MGHSQDMTVTKAIIHTFIFTLLSQVLYTWYGRQFIPSVILKFLFCSNNLLMVASWYEAILIAKGTAYDERDLAKVMLFTLLFMVLLEIHIIIGGL